MTLKNTNFGEIVKTFFSFLFTDFSSAFSSLVVGITLSCFTWLKRELPRVQTLSFSKDHIFFHSTDQNRTLFVPKF